LMRIPMGRALGMGMAGASWRGGRTRSYLGVAPVVQRLEREIQADSPPGRGFGAQASACAAHNCPPCTYLPGRLSRGR
jgi:hypothetical protein